MNAKSISFGSQQLMGNLLYCPHSTDKLFTHNVSTLKGEILFILVSGIAIDSLDNNQLSSIQQMLNK